MEIFGFLLVFLLLLWLFKSTKDEKEAATRKINETNKREEKLKEKEKEIIENINYLKKLKEVELNLQKSGFKETDIFAKLYYEQRKALVDFYTAKIKDLPIGAAEQIKQLKDSWNTVLYEKKQIEYTLYKYEQLFPWIKEFKDMDLSLATRGFYEKNNLPPNVWNNYNHIKEKGKKLLEELESAKKQNEIDIENMINRSKEKIKEDENILIEKRKDFETYCNERLTEITQKEKKSILEIAVAYKNLDNEAKTQNNNIKQKLAEIQKKVELLNSKIKDIPVLAAYIADVEEQNDKLRESGLSARIGITTKVELKALRTDKKQYLEMAKSAEYKCLYYESLVPWLSEMEDEPIDTKKIGSYITKDINETDDAAKYWLTPEEYTALSDIEKYQIALDRYYNRNKTNAEIGRDYERYIGYKYESKGYNVEYRGIIDGFEDRGRDLICTKENKVLIVQCKCWSKKKEIHENHINQLFGTTIRYYLEKNSKATFNKFFTALKKGEIELIFVTSTKLSEVAKSFAQSLNIKVFEDVPLEKYPMIKCNINRRTKEKIYHLPFDQQYDNVKIDDVGEFFAMTVQEAEDAGFRRAKRWFKTVN